jgi:hypothetical protein
VSTRENILAAFATTLGALASGRVYRERKEQLPAVPAIVITPANEEASEQLLGVMDAEISVNVELYVRGDTPSNAADSLLSSVQSALCADLSLGLGSDVQLLPRRTVRWEQDNYDEARITVTYSVFYRTTFGGM